MTAPTPQDAQLVVQLAQLAAVQGLDKAVAWLFAHKMPTEPAAFGERYPRGSKGHRHATAVLNYFETIGALWKHGLLNEDLLFDWLWVSGVWERVKGLALAQRKEYGEAHLWELVEAMALAQERRDQAHGT
jgi:hypothetical protein